MVENARTRYAAVRAGGERSCHIRLSWNSPCSLDDDQNIALEMTDWSPLQARASITVFNDRVADAAQRIERLRKHVPA